MRDHVNIHLSLIELMSLIFVVVSFLSLNFLLLSKKVNQPQDSDDDVSKVISRESALGVCEYTLGMGNEWMPGDARTKIKK